MKSKLLTSLTAAVSLVFASCAAGPNTQAGALTGAALGGVAGAIIGNNVGDGDAGTGALIGAELTIPGDSNLGERHFLRLMLIFALPIAVGGVTRITLKKQQLTDPFIGINAAVSS